MFFHDALWEHIRRCQSFYMTALLWDWIVVSVSSGFYKYLFPSDVKLIFVLLTLKKRRRKKKNTHSEWLMFSWHCDRKQSRQLVQMAPSELVGSYSRRDITGRRGLLPGFVVEALLFFLNFTLYWLLSFTRNQTWGARVSPKMMTEGARCLLGFVGILVIRTMK